MKPVLKIASSIGRVIGKVFFPITVLMSAFDGVMGFIEGFKANGIIGGISGAFFGIIDGLVMKVLDLIKDLVSWVAEKLGFAGISEALDNFSFSEIWQGIGDKVQEFISYIKNFFGNLISSGISGIKKLFGFGGDEEEAPSNKESSRVADIRRRKMNRGRNSQEEKDADSLNLDELLKFNGADASDGAEVNARSQSAAGAANVITVVAPQTANVNNTSQSMNQTVSIPATANPNKARGRSGRRNRQYS